MTQQLQRSLAKTRFIRDSINHLIKLAEAEKFDMLAYLLETARHESETLELRLKAGAQ